MMPEDVDDMAGLPQDPDPDATEALARALGYSEWEAADDEQFDWDPEPAADDL